MGPLLIDTAARPPDSSFVVSYNHGMIAILVYLLLSFVVQKWCMFGAFLSAFVAKVVDMEFAAAGHHTSSPVNGTSLFHVLTAAAMYLHYRDEIASQRTLSVTPTVTEQIAEEFGAGFDKTERWKSLVAGSVTPTTREAQLIAMFKQSSLKV